MVTLTSFQNAHRHKGEKYSIALFQPKDFNFDELTFFAPLCEDFYDIRTKRFLKSHEPHDFYEGLTCLESALNKAFESREEEILHFMRTLERDRNIVLCCWCPHSKASRDQLKHLGVFACHSGLVGRFILNYRPDIEVRLDRDRDERLVPQWRYGNGEQVHMF